MQEITVYVPDTVFAVRAFSEMNPWIDCFVIVPVDCLHAIKHVKHAMELYCADEEQCYGDLIRAAMSDIECPYKLLLCEYDEETDEPTEFWKSLCIWITRTIPVHEVCIDE